MAARLRPAGPRSSRGSIRQGLAAPPGARIEKDLLGEHGVPADALYGIQTVRAVENLQFSGRVLGNYPDYVRALATVKRQQHAPIAMRTRSTRGAWTRSNAPATR